MTAKNGLDGRTLGLAEEDRWATRPVRRRWFSADAMAKGGYVYILASKSDVLYVGVTARLARRMIQHRQKVAEGFTSRYNVLRLMYWERYDDIRGAIAREKQIKGWSRAKKIALIESTNPKWKDMAEDYFPIKEK